ncbi:uncharacterized protein LOC135141897 [Zophobas morio]|uniref:uncharacterized protein LOC135141897 n=1 Tax=Zophobas morio TaxID=2755281 RepID=UPI003083C3B7
MVVIKKSRKWKLALTKNKFANDFIKSGDFWLSKKTILRFSLFGAVFSPPRRANTEFLQKNEATSGASPSARRVGVGFRGRKKNQESDYPALATFKQHQDDQTDLLTFQGVKTITKKTFLITVKTTGLMPNLQTLDQWMTTEGVGAAKR